MRMTAEKKGEVVTTKNLEIKFAVLNNLCERVIILEQALIQLREEFEAYKQAQNEKQERALNLLKGE